MHSASLTILLHPVYDCGHGSVYSVHYVHAIDRNLGCDTSAYLRRYAIPDDLPSVVFMLDSPPLLCSKQSCCFAPPNTMLRHCTRGVGL
jgi:hypothetical protein